MRILLTNNSMAERAGTELYTYELAVRLRRLGHNPVVYSPTVGQVGQALWELGIPVIAELSALQESPDLIHGHHHLEAMTACLAFPNVPAVYVCHGWLPLAEQPPTFPTIMTYIGVGPLTHERIMTSVKLDGRPAVIVPSFFDDETIELKPEIAAVPRKALIYNNNLDDQHPLTKAILEACNERRIAVASIGRGFGSVTFEPGKVLREFDIVFAVGRSALEAMASGCAAIVCDSSGVAGLATAEGLEGPGGLLNLSARSRLRVSSRAIGAEIDRYSPALIQRASEHVRSTRPLSLAVTKFVSIYQDAIARFQEMQPCPPDQMLADTSRYLRSLAPLLQSVVIPPQ
ncbi:glycosyltransferase [Devosia sp.]|uniref:glycosyltransferase n=1 Tax=Devosia sp. TaxID=1871048 RepID=UPI003BA889C2